MRLSAIVLVLLILVSPASFAFGQESADPASNPAVDVKKLARELASEFTAAKTAEEQAAVIQRALALPGQPADALKLLLGKVEKEVGTESRRFLIQFQKLAPAEIRKRAVANLEDINSLRDELRLLRNTVDLTKDAIVSKGDPAIARLQEILLPAPATLLAENERLAETDAAVRKLYDWYAQLGAAVGPDFQPESTLADYETQQTQAVLTAAGSAYDQKVLAANAELAAKIDAEEYATVLRCNEYRLLCGLNAVAIDLKLCDAARGHSQDMNEHDFFDHVSPVPGKENFTDRARQAGTFANAENILNGGVNGKVAQDRWFHSPGHHKNMFGKYRRIGVGRDEGTYTELFGS